MFVSREIYKIFVHSGSFINIKILTLQNIFTRYMHIDIITEEKTQTSGGHFSVLTESAHHGPSARLLS